MGFHKQGVPVYIFVAYTAPSLGAASRKVVRTRLNCPDFRCCENLQAVVPDKEWRNWKFRFLKIFEEWFSFWAANWFFNFCNKFCSFTYQCCQLLKFYTVNSWQYTKSDNFHQHRCDPLQSSPQKHRCTCARVVLQKLSHFKCMKF